MLSFIITQSSKAPQENMQQKQIYGIHILYNTYWLKIAYFCYPSLVRRPRFLCSLWNFAVKLTTRKL